MDTKFATVGPSLQKKFLFYFFSRDLLFYWWDELVDPFLAILVIYNIFEKIRKMSGSFIYLLSRAVYDES